VNINLSLTKISSKVSGEQSLAPTPSTNLALRSLGQKIKQKPGIKFIQKTSVNKSTLIDPSEGGCFMARIKTFQRFLENQPQARPGICTILVGLTLFTFGLVLTLLGAINPNWTSLSFVVIGLIVTFVGSFQLFLYFHNVNEKRHQINRIENGDQRSDTIALATSSKYSFDSNFHLSNGPSFSCQNNGMELKNKIDSNYITQAYKIFLRFQDPLVLRTPTIIIQNCKFEFPQTEIDLKSSSSSNADELETISEVSKMQYVDGILRISEDEVVEESEA